MYAIIGATGNTGGVIAEKLLAAGQKVRAIGRNAARLAPLVQKGAEPFVADVTDAEALAKAFAGANAVYVMIPPNLASPDVAAYQERVSDAASAAISKAGVEYAVLLSSVGGDKSDRTGPVVGLHNFEQKLSAVGPLKALFVRAGYFMENVLPQAGVIRQFGSAAGPLRGDLSIPMIASRDIGDYAAKALLRLDFSGKAAKELLGQRDLNYNEATKIIGDAIGKPGLAYMQAPRAQLKPVLMQMGMSESQASLLLEMSDALNSGYMAALEPRSAANTTPTSFEQFVADVFVPLFKGKGAGAE
ncbi:MAG: NmrA family NAD(P)-binding protein [Acidobacteriota bacterium]|nr:NmrA family NAD(P)-binding protein [Acidobacteriota bacterium]